MKTTFPAARLPRPSMMLLLAAGLGVTLLAAHWMDIDRTVRAPGQLAPDGHTQVVQAADGGVLARLLVREGQLVARGQLLAELEGDRASAAYQESQTRHAALKAALARASAEAAGASPDFSAASGEHADLVAAQRVLHRQRRRSEQAELAALEDARRLAQEELRTHTLLLQSGDTSQLEVMRARRQVSELEARMDAVRNKYRQEASTEAARLAEELAASRHKVQDRRSVLEHTNLVAPVAGIVKSLRVTTLGGVLRTGDELMQISPTEGELLVETRIAPADVAQLAPGMNATVRLDAFDYTVHGVLHGTLSHIGADTVTETVANGQSQTFYRAHVRVRADSGRIQLRPGMTATVDIHTGSRSLLNYLAKPLGKAFSGALSER